jgi:hypothetical protein
MIVDASAYIERRTDIETYLILFIAAMVAVNSKTELKLFYDKLLAKENSRLNCSYVQNPSYRQC